MDWNPRFYEVSPVFWPLKPLAEVILKHRQWPHCLDLMQMKQLTDSCVATASGQPVCFVPQENIGNEMIKQQYESRIYLTGQVATRSRNWHDFFNALVWILFPQAKAALNRIHHDALSKAPIDKTAKRGPLRDAATLVDESGVIVLTSQPTLIDLLRRHEWKTVFWQHRKIVLASMRFMVFGHALYEKALNPYIGMTGKGVFFLVNEMFWQQSLTEQLKAVDLWLADFLIHKLISNADLSPIPILGYPEWLSDNRYADFYDNRSYFRPLNHVV